MTPHDELAIARQDAIHQSLTYMVKYIIVEGTYAEQLRAQAVLSDHAAVVAQRVAGSKKVAMTLMAGPVPPWLREQQADRH